MTISDTLLELLTGGLLGVTGQGLRVIVGIKKMNDEALQKGTTTKNLFVTSTLVISLLIGFFAGILATFSMTTFGDGTPLNKANMFALLGAGYAGTDFIEGFMKKNLPADTTDPDPNATPPKGPSPQPGS